MSEQYYSLSQLKSIMRTEGNQWTGPYEVIYQYDLKKLKPADVRAVPRGEWIRRCDSIFAGCPNCRCEVTQIKASVFRDGKGRIDFCPNCGAKMGGQP